MKIIFAATIFAAIGYLYFRSLIVAAFFTLIVFIWKKYDEKEVERKLSQNVTQQFNDLLQSLNSTLASGSNFETALKYAQVELKLVWADEQLLINKELKKLLRKMDLNIPIEIALKEMAEALNCQEAVEFSYALYLCKRTGGNIINAIRISSNTLRDRLIIEQEIRATMEEKIIENKVLMLFPHGIMLMLSITANSYVEPLFNTLLGRGLVVGTLCLIAGAMFLSNKILRGCYEY